MARPRFKPTKAQRDRVKLLKADGWSNERIAAQLEISRNTLEDRFAAELEFGADAKTMENLESAEKAAKKGNASAIKWLQDRYDLARAKRQLDERAGQADEHPVQHQTKPPKLGKKEALQEAAKGVTGKFAVPAGPKILN